MGASKVSEKQKNKPGGEVRTKLLKAAMAVYAERGLDGASVRLVTDRAGARLGAITELFGPSYSPAAWDGVGGRGVSY